MIDTLLDKVGNWNPQLLRELKGRLTSKNMVISAGITALGQILLYLYFKSLLVVIGNGFGRRDRYCTGPGNYYDRLPLCTTNTKGIAEFNHSLWSLDFFITLSIIGIIGLLVVGVYLLIDDLSREEKQGTLNFIRLSPQNSKNILLGKLLGVPALVYLALLVILPLHFGLGIAAHIPAHLILAFYAVVAVSCFLFYSAALLFALAGTGLGGLQAWLGSGLTLGFLFIMAIACLENQIPFDESPLNWLVVFYPGYILPYLVSKTPHSLGLIDYLNINDFAKLTWFSRSLWSNPSTAFTFTFVNYGLGIYWLWHGLDRRFQNRSISPFSKGQSYWLSSSTMFVLIGFAVQHREYGNYKHNLFDNFSAVLVLQLMLCGGLMAALSPHRKTLQTWSRYRHQKSKKNLLWDLMWGEKSPATLAIALNLFSTSTILLAAIFLTPLAQYRLPLIMALLVSNGVILLYASLAQWLLLQKNKQRVIFAIVAVVALLFIPSLAVGVLRVNLSELGILSIFSIVPVLFVRDSVTFMPLFSLVSQGIAIALINVQMTRQLRQLGESDMKALLADNSRSQEQLSGVS
ncbi:MULTISPECIES: hypothetical protein [Spirulina sp. CCY15215]|uniref:hypothetical protein n=1 Tax=Spirulina sp. CCY15215 TaxID=2767591 RepID=UPI00194E0121|nr:hypothetical protein [Spirulina major]